jgi:hypothetical protein
MLIMTYALLLLACSFILGLLGFFVGRCARPIPIIDSRMPQVLTYVKAGSPSAVRGGDNELPAKPRSTV